MFIVYLVLFLLGFYLFGLAFAIDSDPSGYIFVAGILSVSLAVALLFHLPSAADRSKR
ncbi:hypothetical protein [uncultured Microbacterium sp.]|uniref:Uncharacterized protein n=1 Tax=uncultured Microbacterium sp. TaxID=191216 RepID=A0A1Y5PGC3_9MICO|nr:hypothetical protein [uncultured Microbacterium sp.]SBS75161.1 exported hypothetical protein [uncultured Microbacterium sp.]